VHLSEIARTPDKPAIVMAGSGRVVTYAELDRRSRQVAALIRARGLGPKDHVALLMDNSPEFLEVAWGAQRAGLYWTPVNWHLTAEAAYVVHDCGAAAVRLPRGCRPRHAGRPAEQRGRGRLRRGRRLSRSRPARRGARRDAGRARGR
jgi:acyl-coenzyme A synthetase/AMP-(fatty) acid ligase